jgi:hypothetical protein
MISNEAAQISYRSGIRELGPLAQRVIDLEALVQKLNSTVERLAGELSKTRPAHLAKVENR